MSRDAEAGGPAISTERLLLMPLTVQDAAEMVGLLGDPALYTFIGGRPPDLPELTRRFERLEVGSSGDGTAVWRNWVVRLRSDGAAIGYVQATIATTTGVADVAWLIGTRWQGLGYAREAARGMAAALASAGATGLVAHVHPEHRASAGVARALGLAPTGRTVDGEDEWAVDLTGRPSS